MSECIHDPTCLEAEHGAHTICPHLEQVIDDLRRLDDRWQTVLAEVHTNTVPGPDGEGVEERATPESIKAHIEYLQAEWDAAERRAAAIAASLEELSRRGRAVDRERDRLADFVTRPFPIQDGPSVPWGIMLPHERQAQRNHGGQTLARLADRGGLGASEAWAVVNDRDYVFEERRLGSSQAMVERWRDFASGANLAVLRTWSQTAANALADACAAEVRAGRIPDRGRVADALRDYQDERSPGPAVPR